MKFISNAKTKIFPLLILGFFLGALSWGIVSLVSDRFEPFDSGVGWFIGQFILSAMAFGVGYQLGIRQVFIFAFSAYVGMNAYAYLFGGSEQRAWFFLGLITTLALLVIPTIFGLCGRVLKYVRSKFRKQA